MKTILIKGSMMDLGSVTNPDINTAETLQMLEYGKAMSLEKFF